MTRMSSASASPIGVDVVGDPALHPDAALIGPVAAPVRRSCIRLLLLTDTSISAAGGSERFLRNLLSRLPADRYQATVVQLIERDEPETDQRRDPLLAGGRLHILPVGAVYGLRGLRAWWTIRRLMRREHFDIVQSHHEKSDLINALLPRRRGTVHVTNRRDMGFNKSPRLRWLFRLLRRRFHYTLAPSQSILAELECSERLDAGRALCIPNGVDTLRFRPAQAAPAVRDIRGDLGIASDCVVFGCVATLTGVKRHVDLVEAFAVLVRHSPQARLLLVGEGPLRACVEQQIGRLGLGEVVYLLGDQDQVECLLPAMDVMVMASSTEGMSNAILEAMASGLPVIATAVGGNPQLVTHRIEGLLVPAHDPAALAEAMIELVDSSQTRQHMGAAARRRCERDFSVEAMVRAFDSLYQRLAR